MKLPHKTLIALLLIAAGCTQRNERVVTNSLKDGLTSSNQMLMNIIGQNYQTLADRLNDPLVHERAMIWAPKMTLLQRSSVDCIAYIDSMAAGGAIDSREIEKRLLNYRHTLQSITANTPIDIGSLFASTYIDDDPDLQQAMFCRLKNDLLRQEYKIIRYSLDQLSHKGWCIDYSPDMMINNTRFRKGDTVCIKGWYGLTISQIDLTLTVRDSTIPQKQEEPIEYKFTANDPPGAYSLPVQMHFTKPDGTTTVVEKTFKYKIIH